MATTTDQPVAFKPKKSVALSGTPAGNTALCTVGRTGNDLHYRGYDIADLATHCEFEEVAYLLLRGKLPNAMELAAYKQKLTRLRGLPANVYESAGTASRCHASHGCAAHRRLRPGLRAAGERRPQPCGSHRVRGRVARHHWVDAPLLAPLQPQWTNH